MGVHITNYDLDLINRVVSEGSLVNLVPPQISGGHDVGDTLTCSEGTWTPEEGITFAYQWFRDDVEIADEDAATYVLVGDDVGASIDCVVTATADVATASLTAVTDAVQDPPANTVAPVVSGTAEKGSTLSCTTGTWTGSPTITYTYAWRRAGVAIGGATNSTYVTVTADIGAAIGCLVTADNDATGTVSAASSNTITVTVVAPVNTVAPLITGDPEVGATLTCSNGTWTGTATITYTKAWRKDGVANGSTGNTYVTVVGDIGSDIDCVVTADNDAVGTVSQASSNQIEVIAIDYGIWDSAADGDAVLSNGDRTASYDPVASGAIVPCLSTTGKTSGKYYVEFEMETGNDEGDIAVIRASNFPLSANPPTAFDASTGFDWLGVKWLNGNPTSAGQAGRVFVAGDVVGLVIDFTGELITLFVNNVEVGSHTLSTAGSGAYYLSCSGRNNGQSTIVTVCTDPADMAYSGRLASESASTWLG